MNCSTTFPGRVAVLFFFLASLVTLRSEADQDRETDVAAEEEVAADDDASSDVDDDESEDEDDEFDDEELDEDDEEPLTLPGPDTIELDLEALGEMDPEADLKEGGVLDQDDASQLAVESWTERALDILELHGYFRVRPELYHKFYMRNDDAIYSRPMVQQYPYEPAEGEARDPNLGEDCGGGGEQNECSNSTLAGANMRLRLEPTLNISETVWIKTQLDFLDNVTLGSTPRYYQQANLNRDVQIETGRIYGWDMGAPSSSDIIVVRRAWGEVMTPFGQLRFGRMGDHWGLGMLHNAGNGLDQDFGDSVDRIMFASQINNWLIAPAFDFPSEGLSAVDAAGRPFDVGQLDDSYQLSLIVAYKHDEEDQKAMLRRGDWVVNTGLYFLYRWQTLSFENPDDPAPQTDDFQKVDYQFYPRQSWSIVPDFWFQFIKGSFHLELEAAMIFGEVSDSVRAQPDIDAVEDLDLLQYGGVVQADYGVLADQLRIGFEFGFASGDRGVEGLRAPATFDQRNDSDNSRHTAFAFNPAYNTDLILYHHILGTVSQSYYFKPWLQYDFLRTSLGKQLGMRFDLVYSRAVFEDSTISNNSTNLGIELDGQVFYASADGFYAGLKYGVLFPLGGFEGTADPDLDGPIEPLTDIDLTVPQTLQLLLGITY